MNRGSLKIAIFGGGNGWELDAINHCLSKTNNALQVECTIIDNIVWPINNIEENKGKMIGSIEVVKKNFFDYLKKVKKGDYNLLYFSRCINYIDTKDTDCLSDLLAELSRIGTKVAFAQIELDKEGNTRDFNVKFKKLFGFNEGLKCESLDWPKTTLYVRDF